MHNRRAFALALMMVAVACGPSGHGAVAQQTHPPAGAYTLDPRHAAIYFRVNHLGFSHIVGRFNTFAAQLALDPQTPERSSVTATIQAQSIDSGVPSFDGFLRGERFLHASANPEIRFESRQIERTGPSTARIIGDLTMNGATHAVTLDATLNGSGRNPFESGSIAGFSAHGTLSRAQFGLDAFSQQVRDEVEFFIEAEFVTGR